MEKNFCLRLAFFPPPPSTSPNASFKLLLVRQPWLIPSFCAGLTLAIEFSLITSISSQSISSSFSSHNQPTNSTHTYKNAFTMDKKALLAQDGWDPSIEQQTFGDQHPYASATPPGPGPDFGSTYSVPYIPQQSFPYSTFVCTCPLARICSQRGAKK